jgi:hypothetical protein
MIVPTIALYSNPNETEVFDQEPAQQIDISRYKRQRPNEIQGGLGVVGWPKGKQYFLEWFLGLTRRLLDMMTNMKA